MLLCTYALAELRTYSLPQLQKCHSLKKLTEDSTLPLYKPVCIQIYSFWDHLQPVITANLSFLWCTAMTNHGCFPVFLGCNKAGGFPAQGRGLDWMTLWATLVAYPAHLASTAHKFFDTPFVKVIKFIIISIN